LIQIGQGHNKSRQRYPSQKGFRQSPGIQGGEPGQRHINRDEEKILKLDGIDEHDSVSSMQILGMKKGERNRKEAHSRKQHMHAIAWGTQGVGKVVDRSVSQDARQQIQTWDYDFGHRPLALSGLMLSILIIRGFLLIKCQLRSVAYGTNATSAIVP
jgi:hypothetical protein